MPTWNSLFSSAGLRLRCLGTASCTHSAVGVQAGCMSVCILQGTAEGLHRMWSKAELYKVALLVQQVPLCESEPDAGQVGQLLCIRGVQRGGLLHRLS